MLINHLFSWRTLRAWLYTSSLLPHLSALFLFLSLALFITLCGSLFFFSHFLFRRALHWDGRNAAERAPFCAQSPPCSTILPGGASHPLKLLHRRHGGVGCWRFFHDTQGSLGVIMKWGIWTEMYNRILVILIILITHTLTPIVYKLTYIRKYTRCIHAICKDAGYIYRYFRLYARSVAQWIEMYFCHTPK